MKTVMIRHLFWKELRQQWHVWVALFLGTLLFQLIPIVFRYEMVPGTANFVFAIGMVMAACFSVASAGILFAGEVEEGTADRLRQLPISTATLALGKITFSVAATCLLLLATWVVGAGIVVGARGDLAAINYDEFAIHETSLLSLFLWSLLFSLLLQRVLNVLAIAVACELATRGIVSNILPESRDFSIHVLVEAAIFSILLAAIVWSLQIWHRRPTRLGGLRRMTIGFSRRKSRLSGSRWLQWAATRGTPTARLYAVLVWKELRTAIPFAVLVGAAGLVLIGCSPWSPMPINYVFLATLPALCGIMVFTSERYQDTYLFHTHRGVSPAMLWTIKNAFWLTLTTLLWVVFYLFDLSMGVMVRSFPGGQISFAHAVEGLFQQWMRQIGTAPPGGELVLSHQLAYAGTLILGQFAIGQLASFWFRRTVIVWAVAILGCIIWILGLMFGALFDVSYAVTLVPLGLLWFLATLRTGHIWLEGARPRWRVATQIAWVVFPVLICTGASLGARVFQVPDIDPGFDWRSHEANWSRYDKAWNDRLQNALARCNGYYATGMVGQFLPRLSGASLEEVADEIAELTHAPRESPGLNPLHTIPLVHQGSMMSIGPRTLLMSGNVHLRNGNLEAAWRRFRDAHILTRFFQRECASWSDFIALSQASQAIFTQIQEWGNHQNQTGSLLQVAVDDPFWKLPDHTTGVYPSEMLKNRYVAWRQILEFRRELGGWLQHEIEKNTNWAASIRSVTLTERMRGLRLHNQMTHWVMNEPLHSARTEPRLPTDAQQIRRWAATTNWFREVWTDPLITNRSDRLHATSEMRIVLDDLAMQRGTWTLLACQLYRHNHGTWPQDLAQLNEADGVCLYLDPWANAEFGYNSNGSSKEVYVTTKMAPDGQRVQATSVVRANQPVLWSAGVHLRYFRPAAQDAILISESTIRVPLDKADSNRLVFVVLGTERVAMANMLPREAEHTSTEFPLEDGFEAIRDGEPPQNDDNSRPEPVPVPDDIESL